MMAEKTRYTSLGQRGRHRISSIISRDDGVIFKGTLTSNVAVRIDDSRDDTVKKSSHLEMLPNVCNNFWLTVVEMIL